MEPRPFVVRQGRAPQGGPYKGVPAHMRSPLEHWFMSSFVGLNAEQDIYNVAAACRFALRPERSANALREQLLSMAGDDEEKLLDIVHATVQLVGNASLGNLDRVLSNSGSIWTVEWGMGLQLRVDPMTEQAYQAATSPEDVAGGELTEAWGRAFGREPDASDAWDHAIKAVEAVLIPVVVPKQAKATLSHVIGHLARQGDQFRLVLRGSDDSHSVAPLVAMLRLLWPNPDRHGSAEGSPQPTLEEAQAAVHLAVTIVQWARDGAVAPAAGSD